jgi:HlyD family secretion protein
MREGESEIAKRDTVDLRSEDVQEIMGYVPHWLIRSGIGLLFAMVIIFLIISWYFKYPDTIKTEITITTRLPPVVIIARSGGKLQPLLVANNGSVRKGDLLTVIENPADYRQVFHLKKQLNSLKDILAKDELHLLAPLQKCVSLGELQSTYEIFAKSYEDFAYFLRESIQLKKIAAQETQINEYQKLCAQLEKQSTMYEQDLKISQGLLERALSAYKDGIIPRNDLEGAKSACIQKQISIENLKSTINQQKIQIAILTQSLVETEWQYQQDKKRLYLLLNEAFKNLVSQIDQWEYRYMLFSPIDGKVAFVKYWSDNQNAAAGESIFKIVPEKAESILGVCWLPFEGSGKVQVGQKVDIELLNFPDAEYGTVSGVVQSKSIAPAEKAYLVEVALPHGLQTNYHKNLPFSQELRGTAEITTEDIRLLWRFFAPIRNILNKHV